MEIPLRFIVKNGKKILQTLASEVIVEDGHTVTTTKRWIDVPVEEIKEYCE